MSEREFDRPERLVHWSYAALFLGLVLTGALLVWSPAARAIALGGQRVVPLVHVGLGVALLVAPFLPFAARAGRVAAARPRRVAALAAARPGLAGARAALARSCRACARPPSRASTPGSG